MNQLFLAMVLYLLAGCLPLLLHRSLSVAKLCHLALLALGTLCGLYGVFAAGADPHSAHFSCTWLHQFNIALRFDGLARVFLVPSCCWRRCLGSMAIITSTTANNRSALWSAIFSLRCC